MATKKKAVPKLSRKVAPKERPIGNPPAVDIETLTVKQLIGALAKFHPDMPVMVAHSTGDHWGSVIALDINEAKLEEVRWSGYHDAFRIEDYETPMGVVPTTRLELVVLK